MSKERLPPLTIGRHTFEVPIAQGGMSIRGSGADLVVAVSQQGGLGTIGGVGRGVGRPKYQHLGYRQADIQALMDEILMTKEMDPGGIHAVNILHAVSGFDGLVKAAVTTGANIIISGAGLPVDLPALTADHPQVALVPMVSSLRVADFFCRQWWHKYQKMPDAIIVEEPATAGGHLGASTKEQVADPALRMSVVIPQIRKYLEDQKRKEEDPTRNWNIPIIAAGGIHTRQGIDQMLALGASGVQIATPFVCTPECEFPDAFKRKYLEAERTFLTESPVGLMGRVVKTEFSQRVARGEDINGSCRVSCLKKCGFRDSIKEGKREGYCIVDALVRAREARNDQEIEEAIVFAGTDVIHSRMRTVKQVFAELTG